MRHSQYFWIESINLLPANLITKGHDNRRQPTSRVVLFEGSGGGMALLLQSSPRSREWLQVRARYWPVWRCNGSRGHGIKEMNTCCAFRLHWRPREIEKWERGTFLCLHLFFWRGECLQWLLAENRQRSTHVARQSVDTTNHFPFEGWI